MDKKKQVVEGLTEKQYEKFDKVIKMLQSIMREWIEEIRPEDNTQLSIPQLMETKTGKKFLIANSVIQTLISVPAFAETMDSHFESKELAIEFLNQYDIIYDKETEKLELIDRSKYDV